MKKNILPIVLFIILVIIIAIILFYNSVNNKKDLSNVSNQSATMKQNEMIGNIQASNTLSDNTVLNSIFSSSQAPVETEISSFSTKLSGDNNRLENIRISCNSINGTILNSGDTFSFNNVVGKPTSDKGYKEADVIVNDKLVKGIGGGNCQVSSTLYNAALNVDGISIVERNAHGIKVSYVEEGKDACVSYGSLDMRFKNNTGKKLEIYMNCDNNNINAKIVELSF